MRPGPRCQSAALCAALVSLGSAGPPARAEDGLATGLQAGSSAVFSGRYRLTLGFGPSCAQRGTSVSVLFDVQESPSLYGAKAGTEVSGRPTEPGEASVAQLVLLRRQDALEGAIGMIRGETLRTSAGLRVYISLMGQGTAEPAAPAARARGTAFGDLMLSRPGDDTFDSLGFCTARDHSWSLDRE